MVGVWGRDRNIVKRSAWRVNTANMNLNTALEDVLLGQYLGPCGAFPTWSCECL